MAIVYQANHHHHLFFLFHFYFGNLNCSLFSTQTPAYCIHNSVMIHPKIFLYLTMCTNVVQKEGVGVTSYKALFGFAMD